MAHKLLMCDETSQTAVVNIAGFRDTYLIVLVLQYRDPVKSHQFRKSSDSQICVQFCTLNQCIMKSTIYIYRKNSIKQNIVQKFIYFS